jgi:hypothetical protein
LTTGEVLAGGGRGDDDLLGARVEVLGGRVALGEQPGGLDHDVDAEVFPRQLGGVAYGEALEALAVDDDLLVGRGHREREAPEDRVVLEQVRERRVVGDVVDRDDLDLGVARLLLRLDRAPEVAPDPAEPVDAHTHRHAVPPR